MIPNPRTRDTTHRHRRLLFSSCDEAALPLLVRRAGVLADVDSDDEFEVGLNVLITGFRVLVFSSRQ
ncbi:TetR/AcrR family transcriptional regulator C-terminal domain-containing protein [Streptomyces sp. NPDC059629]|uniref:TetR/AcrR family transcriptional regulator C-terminal domain-containing protein n=1 Tax=Streptomyces sp. NPDC059629 TaxID=3346889 RepID=UPI0036A6A2FC